MPDGLVDYALALYTRIWPSLLGAAIALYFHPPDSGWADKLFAGAASVGVALLFGPATVDYFEVESPAVAAAIHGAFALFGLSAAREVFTSIRDLGLPALVRDRLRRLLG